jgi:glycosyltransferase involved in cell wall biosynthesis
MPEARLLLLTPEPDGVRPLVEAAGLAFGNDVCVRAALFSDVAAYLCAADAGLLLRDPHPLNAVASPTKLAEYLLCGLPAVTSTGIGDLDAVIEKEGLGVLVDGFRDPRRLEEAFRRAADIARAGDRSVRAARAARLFALGGQIRAWTDLYRSL